MNRSLAGATNAAITWATSENDGPSTNLVIATVTDVVNGRAFTRTNEFTVIVNELNVAPQLLVPSDVTIEELTELNVSVTATDSDFPANSLTFSLLLPPAGMNINPASCEISWTPTEEQGPSTNLITVMVTDNNPWAINAQQMSTTNRLSSLCEK